MRSHQITITLQEDVVLSATASTLGGNHSLDYIPGAALLGAAAATLYQQVPAQVAFQLFHSGSVRFGNAYPCEADKPSRPIPLAWHRLRAKAGETRLLNHLLAADDEIKMKQEQLRQGFVSDTGHLLFPKTSYRMKTAIDSKTATAATSQLYGYQALLAGQTFAARLDLDDEISESLELSLVKALSGGLLLGRSRTAQYGQVFCDVEPLPEYQAEGDTSDPHSLLLWLQSDLALQDEYGQPVLLPEARHFGLSGSFQPERSFMRFRSYSPYNSHRHSHDSERQVITQGSVLSFKLDAPLTSEQQEQWKAGIGCYRECGLGQVLVNPPLLNQTVPMPESEPPQQDVLGEAPDHPLATWLLRQNDAGGQRRRVRELAEQCAEELAELYRAARRYAGEQPGVLVGPGRSQWGKVSELAKQYASGGKSDGLFYALFDSNNKQAICAASDVAWQTATGAGQATSFAEWLEKQLKGEKDNPGLLAANLAQIARGVISKQEAMK